MQGTFGFSVTQIAAQQRNINPAMSGTTSNILCDGTMVRTDNEGRIKQASYSTGAKVNILESYCLVQSSNGMYWFGDAGGRWYPLD